MEAGLETVLKREVTGQRSVFPARREELSAAGKEEEEVLSKCSEVGEVTGPREYEY